MTESSVRPDTAQVQGPRGHVFVRLMHRNAGAAETTALLFLHPVNLSGRCWISVAERMRDVLCVIIDSRGHGRSHMNGPFCIDDYAADVMAVVEALELRAIHLAGASLGGSVACAVAAAIPGSVQSLAALGASLEPADPDSLAALAEWRVAGATADLFDAFLDQEVRHGLPPAIAGAARRQVDLDTRGSDLIKEVTWNAFAEDALGHLPMMQAPALVADRLTRFIQGVAIP